MKTLPAALALLLLVGTGAGAQEPPVETDTVAPARPIPATSPACKTGPISYIFVDNHSIFDTSDPSLSPRFAWAYHAANKLHRRTRRSVIRRELLFHQGDCYDPALLDETARLLRGYNFISRADVYGIRQPDGSYHVIVDTQDEWSTTVDLRVAFSQGVDFQGARFREANLLGMGQELGASYIDHDVTREYGLTYSTPQLLGTRWDFRLAASHDRAGNAYDQALEYPFLSEAGRWAFRQSFSRRDRFFDYISDGRALDHVLLPVRDKSFDMALVTRIGRPGNLTLFGGGLAMEDRSYPGGALLTPHGRFEDGVPVDSAGAAELGRQMQALNNVRLVLLLGQRNISWVQRRGLDALRGVQDVKLGVETSVALARSMPTLGDDDDLAATLTLYSAFEAGDLLVAGRFRGEGRRDFDAPAGTRELADLYGAGEILAYLRPTPLPRQTFVLRGAAAGGWFTTTPFQLTLGGDDGLRGYRPERFPGGRRLVFSGEDRIYFGWPFRDVLDLGGTLFADVGRIWPGDVPFGKDSGWQATVGAGLRGSFPAGGRTTYRIDVAFPVGAASVRDARLIVSVGELLGLSTPFDLRQIDRSRTGGLSGDLFSFPR